MSVSLMLYEYPYELHAEMRWPYKHYSANFMSKETTTKNNDETEDANY